VCQVGEAVGQMDQVTQQNAALVEESAAAAESLRVQALRLVQTVEVFKLAPSSPAHEAVAPAVRHAAPARASVERRNPQRTKATGRPALGQARLA